MNKDFADFQKHFKYYQKLFGLNGYIVYFKHEPVDGGFSSITIRQRDRIATVVLASEVSDEDKPFSDIKRFAKHEAIHLLVSRLHLVGHSRYTTEEELDEANEELVVKLEGLIEK